MIKKIIKRILKYLRHFVNCMKSSQDSVTHQRRLKLKAFAINHYKNPNRCEVLVSISEYAVKLLQDSSNPSKELIMDLKSVIIGRNMTICRGKGAYFAGNIEGAEGFRKELQDPWNQVQHAVAGIVIAYQYGKLAAAIVKLLEDETQDDLLYDATFPLGFTLTNENYTELPRKIKLAIGNN